jgi:hypothetical protein
MTLVKQAKLVDRAECASDALSSSNICFRQHLARALPWN